MDSSVDPVDRLVYLISGPVGAGKTTVARSLAKQLPFAAHIESDKIQDMIVSGGLPPSGQELEAEARRQLHLRTRNVALLADSSFESGVTPIIDDVVVYAARLRDYVKFIRSRPVALVMLAAPLEVSRARDAARAEKQVGHIWPHLDAVMRKELPERGLWIDNSTLNPDQTVELILERVLPEGLIEDVI